MNFFEFFQFLSSNVWIYGGSFILILSILVFVHEWGHYIVARMCGVRVEIFSIGFGKELFGFNDSHGTRWKVSLVPLGGYVKMFGDTNAASAGHEAAVENEETGETRPMTEAEKSVAFFAKPLWQRAAIVFAGPAINYIFAIIVMTGLFAVHGKPVTPPVAAAIIDQSAADQGGFEPGDLILSIDGKSIKTFETIRQEMMISLDKERHFIVERAGETIDIYASPEKVEMEDRFGFKHSRGVLGLISPRNGLSLLSLSAVDGQEFLLAEDATQDQQIAHIADVKEALNNRIGSPFSVRMGHGETQETITINPSVLDNDGLNLIDDTPESRALVLANQDAVQFLKFPVGEAFLELLVQAKDITVGTLEALGQMIVGTRSAQELGGVIRIGALAGDMAQQGLVALIMFSALLSINLGFINLFPIPLLDGGHLVFYAIEGIIGKPVPEKAQEYAFRFGFAFLIALMAFTNLNDIVQLLL